MINLNDVLNDVDFCCSNSSNLNEPLRGLQIYIDFHVPLPENFITVFPHCHVILISRRPCLRKMIRKNRGDSFQYKKGRKILEFCSILLFFFSSSAFLDRCLDRIVPSTLERCISVSARSLSIVSISVNSFVVTKPFITAAFSIKGTNIQSECYHGNLGE